VPVPDGLDDAEAVALILNYVTAYQAIHRSAKLMRGGTALVTGAAGGVGQALVQLLRVHEVRVIAAASERSHPLLRALGAEAIEGRTRPVDGATLALVPGGVDAAFDGIGGAQLRQCIRAIKRSGSVVWYGFVGAGALFDVLRNAYDLFIGARASRQLLRDNRALSEGPSAVPRRSAEVVRAARCARDRTEDRADAAARPSA